MAEQKHFKFMDFLNIWVKQKPISSKNMGKVNPHNTGKYGEKQTFESYGFLKCFG